MILHMALVLLLMFFFYFLNLVSLVLPLYSLLLHLQMYYPHYSHHLLKQIIFNNHPNNYLPCIIARALSGNSAMMKVSPAVSPPPVNNNRYRLIPFVVVTDDQQGSSVRGHFPRSDIYQGVHVFSLV